VKKKAKSIIGRPKADIDWNIVDEYLIAGCSGADIAGLIGIADHTLYDRCLSDNGIMFSDYSQQKKAKGNSLLHKAQFDAAVTDKDKSMMIWLGKQRLGQKDKSEVDNNVKNVPKTREEIEAELEEIRKRLFPTK
jgi:predicted alpha/beta superfamily hydrolase